MIVWQIPRYSFWSKVLRDLEVFEVCQGGQGILGLRDQLVPLGQRDLRGQRGIPTDPLDQSDPLDLLDLPEQQDQQVSGGLPGPQVLLDQRQDPRGQLV